MSDLELSATSRYLNTNVYVDDDGNTFFGIWKPLEFEEEDFITEISVKAHHIGALDALSYEVYGNEKFWHIIADFNGIIDPFLDISIGDVLKLPSKQSIDLAFLNAQ